MVSTTPPPLPVAHRPATPVVRHPGLGNTPDLLCEDTAELFFVPAEPPITAVYTAPVTQPTQHGYSHTFDIYFSLIRKLADVGHFHTVTQLLRRSQIESIVLREPVFIVLMTRYAKAGHPGSAVQLLDEMPHIYNCEPTFRSYNVVLDILVGANYHKMAVNLFYTMLHKDVSPTTFTFSIVMKALCLLNEVGRACSLLRGMARHGCVPDMVIYQTPIHALYKENRARDALQLLEEMFVIGSPDVTMINDVIHELCKVGHDAVKLVDRMLLRGCVPSALRYGVLLQGLCKIGRVDEARTMLSRAPNLNMDKFDTATEQGKRS